MKNTYPKPGDDIIFANYFQAYVESVDNLHRKIVLIFSKGDYESLSLFIEGFFNCTFEDRSHFRFVSTNYEDGGLEPTITMEMDFQLFKALNTQFYFKGPKDLEICVELELTDKWGKKRTLSEGLQIEVENEFKGRIAKLIGEESKLAVQITEPLSEEYQSQWIEGMPLVQIMWLGELRGKKVVIS